MFTRQAPQLHTALWLGGLSPAMASQVQNLLGQCRQQIEHRGPISVNNTLPEPRKVTPEQAKIQANVINNFGGNTFAQATLPENPPTELPPLPPLPPGVRPIFYYIGVPGPKGDKGDPGETKTVDIGPPYSPPTSTPTTQEVTVLTSVKMGTGGVEFTTKKIKVIVVGGGGTETLPTVKCESVTTSP